MGFSSQKETTQAQSSAPAPVWFPGQEAYIPEFIQPFKDIFGGNLSGGVAGMLRNVAGDAGAKEAGAAQTRISSTKGMSSPARASAYKSAGDAAVTAAAGVPSSIFDKALSVLQGYALQQPVTGQVSTGSGGGGGGFGVSACPSCYIFRSAGNGELEHFTRKFRDAHFKVGGSVERGYKWMASWLVPLMERSPIIMKVVREGMVYPLDNVARWIYYGFGGKRGWMYIPLAYGWIGVWSVCGMFASIRPQSTPRPTHLHYPSITTTFWNRIKEVL